MRNPVLAMLALLGSFAAASFAQEVLPAPPPPFKGSIGLSVKDSKSDFPILTQGGLFGGYALMFDKGKPVFH